MLVNVLSPFDLILYDGVCGLCQWGVQFVLRRDRTNRFRFAALQSPLGHSVLARHGRSAQALDTVCVVADYEGPHEKLLSKGGAALYVVSRLGGAWRVAHAFSWLPDRVVDAVYDFVAARRYRWFGRLDACPVPSPAHRAKFIDIG